MRNIFVHLETHLMNYGTSINLHLINVQKYIRFFTSTISKSKLTCLQINLYLEQPMEVQLFATFLQRRK
jgi:hypothetical protein